MSTSTTLAQYVSEQTSGPIKLHLGCGGKRWQDFINVDLYPADPNQYDRSRSGCVADVFADIRKLSLPDSTIDEIFTAHTVEHFTRWDAIDMLRDWHRMLKPGGRMVIEMPDFWRCILWLFHPRAKKRRVARNQFYGNQWDRLDFETHRFVWASGDFQRTLREVGFSTVNVTHKTQTHYAGRDMRVEAIK